MQYLRFAKRDGCHGFILAVLLLLLLPAAAPARPNIRASFFAAYPNAVGTQLDNLPSISGHCGVCHYAFTGTHQKGSRKHTEC